MYLKWDINKLILRNVFKNIGFSIEEFGTVYFLYLKAAIHASVHYVVHLLQIKSCVIFKVQNLPLPPVRQPWAANPHTQLSVQCIEPRPYIKWD